MREFDTVVIGAGPAGLSAAAELASQGAPHPPGRCLVLEEGPDFGRRDRRDPRELLLGVGGAGLFSDGKHSFFPAASALWTLPDEPARQRAFAHTAALLARFGVDAGPLPPRHAAASPPAGVWQPKDYRAVYVSLADRFAMIADLWSAAGARQSGTRVIDAERRGQKLLLTLQHAGGIEQLVTANLVIATGRWSARWIRPWLDRRLGATYAFVRVEFGVRIETSATSPLFARLPGVDGKLRFIEPQSGLQLRTFCTCRNGEVVLGEAAGLRAFSGRADGPPSGRSNVGLLVRTADAELGREVIAALGSASPQSFDLAQWRQQGAARLSPLFGARGAAALTAALGRLHEFCPELAHHSAWVHAPALEGIGEYPLADDSLQVAPGVWLAGDVGGRFRGIVAAMVSGRYVAQRIMAGTR